MSIFLTGALAVVATMLRQVLAVTMLRVQSTPETILPIAVLYVRIYYSDIPLIAGYNLMSGALRAMGNSRSPLISVVIAALANIGLDFLFVAAFRWELPARQWRQCLRSFCLWYIAG